MSRRFYIITIPVLVVLVLTGGTAALADTAGPGDALFGLDKAMEEARMALADDHGDLEIMMDAAAERTEELRHVNPDDAAKVDMALDELQQSLGDVADAIEEHHAMVKAGDDHMKVEDLNMEVDDFVILLHHGGVALDRLRLEVGDDNIHARIEGIHREIENEIEHENEIELADDGMQVRGELKGNQIMVGGKTVTVAGMDLSAFAGREIKVEGTMDGGMLTVREMQMGDIKIEMENGVPEARFSTAMVEKSGSGFSVTLEGITFTLTGDLAGQLDQVVGREVIIRGPIAGTTINLQRLKTEDAGAEVELKLSDDLDDDFDDNGRLRGDGSLGDDGGDDAFDDNGGDRNRGGDDSGGSGGSGGDSGGSGGSSGSGGSGSSGGSGGGGSTDD